MLVIQFLINKYSANVKRLSPRKIFNKRRNTGRKKKI